MKAHLTLAFALLLICTGAVLAQTPDGQTPAEETVCDNETGAAYGLCNAYCEAMDCESANPSASANACSKVRSKFQNITGRDITCEVCPCVGIAGFDNILANLNSCIDEGDRIVVFIGPSLPEATDGAAANSESNVCGYFTADPPSGETLSIAPSQALACLDAIHAAVADRGVTCQTTPP